VLPKESYHYLFDVDEFFAAVEKYG
jgi:hypothetical protein